MQSSVVKLAGDLDFSRKPELQRLLGAAENSDIAILDLQNVTYLDSSALSSFMSLKKHMVERGKAGVVRVAGASAPLLRIFQICGLDRVFELYDSASEAQQAPPAGG